MILHRFLGIYIKYQKNYYYHSTLNTTTTMPTMTTATKMQSSMFGGAIAFSVLEVTSELNFPILFKEALKAAINPQGNKELSW